MVSRATPVASTGVISLARNHQTPPAKRNGIRLENVAPVQDATGESATRPTPPPREEARRTSHGVAAGDRGGMRHARPAISGSAPGRPAPFDTRPVTSPVAKGNPSPAGASRSSLPSASTPIGWNSRRLRTAEPRRTGSAVISEISTRSGCPRPRRANRSAGLTPAISGINSGLEVSRSRLKGRR